MDGGDVVYHEASLPLTYMNLQYLSWFSRPVCFQDTESNKDNFILSKKSLKKPKGQSDFVYQRTDHTMAKRKNTKGQTTIYKTYT
jgi:hypothetical protein